jgi:hypothetical protein
MIFSTVFTNRWLPGPAVAYRRRADINRSGTGLPAASIALSFFAPSADCWRGEERQVKNLLHGALSVVNVARSLLTSEFQWTNDKDDEDAAAAPDDTSRKEDQGADAWLTPPLASVVGFVYAVVLVGGVVGAKS